MRSSWVEIDLDALRKNTAIILKGLAPGAQLLAPLKGNAYGHGAVQCARVMAEMGAAYFGVAIAEEGVELRKAGFEQPILIFGYTFDDSYDLLFDYNLIPNVFTMEQAEELNALAAERNCRLTIHVSVDTGLSRLGLPLDDSTVEKILSIASMPNLYLEGVFSMFATGYDDQDDTFCRLQFNRFMQVCNQVEEAGYHIKLRHICDGGATFLYPEMHLDMVRPGSTLYGNFSFPYIEYYPVMSVKSRLAAIRKIQPGDTVGYERNWKAERPSVIGVVPCGFVDGTARMASNRGCVLLHGVRCPIVGNVCMDQMMIDITEVADPKVGDEIVLCGTQNGETITLVEAGEFSGTSDTEYVCRQGRRLPMVYLEGGKVVEYVSYV